MKLYNQRDFKILDGLSSYKVFDNGSVYSIKRKTFLSPDKVRKGHLRVYLTLDDGTRKHYFIHRLVAKSFLKNPKDFPFVCHIDSNPENNSVENLRWDDAFGNMKDRKERGMYKDQKGDNNYSSKCKEKDVIDVKKLFKSGVKPMDTFRMNILRGLSPATYYDIYSGRSWSHIKV